MYHDQVFEAKARSSLMSSRDAGAGGLSEADVKVAMARLQAGLLVFVPNFCGDVCGAGFV